MQTEVHSRIFSEARSAQPYVGQVAYARGSFSPYPQGGPKAPPPSKPPRCGEAVAIMDAIDQSRLDFGWVFARKYLPKDFDREIFFSRQRKSLIKVLHSDRSDCIFVDVPETALDLCKFVTRGALDLVQAYSEAAETWLGNDLHSRRQSQGLVFFDSGVTAAFQIKWSMRTPCTPSFATIASFGKEMVGC